MAEKLTISKFREIKSQLTLIIEEASDSSEDEQKYYNQYLELQTHLLSYDLSAIPFDEWKDIAIMSDENHIADFSKTNANIDFSILGYSRYANYKSCNVRNIKFVGKIINSDNFDDIVIKNNPQYFITDLFGDELKQKIYDSKLTIEDLLTLSASQMQDLLSKKLRNSFDSITRSLIDDMGLPKVIQLFFISKDDFKMIYDMLVILNNDIQFSFLRESLRDKIKSCKVTEIKDLYSKYLKEKILEEEYTNIDIKALPPQFVKENRKLFLLGENIPEDLRERYYSRNLSVDDVFDNISLFDDIPISTFISMNSKYYHEFYSLENKLGIEGMKIFLKSYPEIINYIIKGNLAYDFGAYIIKNAPLEINETDDIKKQLNDYLQPFFSLHNQLFNSEQLLLYEPSFFPLKESQQELIELLGLENMKRFERENNFFFYTNPSSAHRNMFNLVNQLIYKINQYGFLSYGMNFKNGTLNYEEFLNNFAIYLDVMKEKSLFDNYQNYHFIKGEFREKHPEIFMDLDAPEELITAYYSNLIDPHLLSEHKEYIPYLIDKNLHNTVRTGMKLSVPGLIDMNGKVTPVTTNFNKEYIKRYGNEKFLKLVSKYGNILKSITVISLNNEIDNEKEIEKSIRKAIYNKILKQNVQYEYLSKVPEFVEEYPEIFIDLSSLTSIPKKERERITYAFYDGELKYEYIKKYPELIAILKNKNLFLAFEKTAAHHNVIFSDLNLLSVFGNGKFLELCSKYGRYMYGAANNLLEELNTAYGHHYSMDSEEIIQKIEDTITSKIFSGNLSFNKNDAPSFLIEKHPEIFLNEDVPEELKKYYYVEDYENGLTLSLLKEHKEWLPYLKDKVISPVLLRSTHLKKQMKKYLELFGEEKAINLGINRTETVMEMMKSNQVSLMKKWYDKTGGKFIPDFVVMQNFSLEEADKFLSSGANWSSLMRIKSFASTPEPRDAMLKLAYSFGVFDQDQRGFKKLQELLTEIPKKIDYNQGYIIKIIDNQINQYSKRIKFFPISTVSEEKYQQMIDHITTNSFNGLFDNTSVINLLENLRKENINIDYSEDIFSQLYRENEDGSYTLTFNQQTCPKSSESIREILEKFREIPIMSPEKAHKLFGGFELKYDRDFREFLLANMDKIMSNSNYISFVSNVQKQFADIKAFNSNRVLTWDLAISFVQSNKYTSVNVGNESVAAISAIAGYSQSDFETLQKIYNYGKQRTFSSIPRIEKTSGKYTYEILRLDDPLAMAIGTLTDCCQALGDVAEICMEHSMVDQNGRVFAVKDELGNIVAQSWVWRKQDVLCFDNIEIPDKAFARAIKENPESGRKGLADEIFAIYKKAAKELISTDEQVYKELLQSGKITKEQYDGLRLGKVTVGLGYNDIAESLKEKAIVDKGDITRPEQFEAPVQLSRGLYTSDSTTQYILEERKDRKEYSGKTLPVHTDIYVEYNDSNFNGKALLTLEKLEIVTKDNPRYLDTSVDEDTNREQLVTEIAENYILNPETTRIVMNSNFAIIYDVNENKLVIGDLLFNTKVDNGEQQMDIEDKVVMQIRLALEQIGAGKEIDISSLNKKQKEMYDKVMNLTDEFDKGRGVGHAR